jgi:integrase/recombinase XerC
MSSQEDNALLFASADVAAELVRWLAHLAAERRMSPKTVEAYERDVRQFLGFLTRHTGEPVSLKALAAIEPRDVRARSRASSSATARARSARSPPFGRRRCRRPCRSRSRRPPPSG